MSPFSSRHGRRLALTAAALVVPCAMPYAMAAQSKPYAPIILRLPASVRALGLGDVGIGSRDDDVLFYNPAQLAIARGTSVSAERFSPTAHDGALSSVTRFNTGGIAVGATVTDFQAPGSNYPANRATMLDRGPDDVTSTSVLLGIGQVFKGTRIGASAKYVDEHYANTSNERALLDLGVSRDFFGSTIALAVQNIGKSFPETFPESMLFDAGADVAAVGPNPLMPLRSTLGVAHAQQAGPLDLYATAAVSMLRTDFVIPAGGLELGYSWLEGYDIVARAGVRRPGAGEGAVTAGLGFVMDRLSIDYALETLKTADGSHVAHRIGLRVR